MKTPLKRPLVALAVCAAGAGTFGLLNRSSDANGGPILIPFWSVMGSGGIVDESDVDEVKFANQSVKVGPETGSVVLRYPLNQPLASMDTLDLVMAVRFRDNGTDSRVRVWIREYDAGENEVSNIGVFDSNDYDPATAARVELVDFGVESFDFFNSVYYLEVKLQKTDASARPELHSVVLAEEI